jgi:hypothetical protein
MKQKIIPKPLFIKYIFPKKNYAAKIFSDFHFCLHKPKKHPFFGELNRISLFWTFIFVQKGKTEGLLENTTFLLLYILLFSILKEKR